MSSDVPIDEYKDRIKYLVSVIRSLDQELEIKTKFCDFAERELSRYAEYTPEEVITYQTEMSRLNL